jgi:hypothetical protein
MLKKFNIYKLAIGASDTFCTTIEARSEYEALRKYRARLTSTGFYTMQKGLRHWSLTTTYGAEYVAL